MKKNLCIMLIAVAGIFSLASCDDDDNHRLPTPEPTKFTEALKQVFPDAKNVKWETDGAYQVAEFLTKNGQVETEVWFDADAKHVMTANDYGRDLFMIPAAVNAGFEKTVYGAAPWIVDDIDEYIRTADTVYVIEVEAKGEKDVHLFFDPQGNLLKESTDYTPDFRPTTKI